MDFLGEIWDPNFAKFVYKILFYKDIKIFYVGRHFDFLN